MRSILGFNTIFWIKFELKEMGTVTFKYKCQPHMTTWLLMPASHDHLVLPEALRGSRLCLVLGLISGSVKTYFLPFDCELRHEVNKKWMVMCPTHVVSPLGSSWLVELHLGLCLGLWSLVRLLPLLNHFFLKFRCKWGRMVKQINII